MIKKNYNPSPHQAFLQGAVRNGSPRKIDFWKKMSDKGCILDAGEPESYLSTLESMMEQLEIAFPGKWDIQCRSNVTDHSEDTRITWVVPVIAIRFEKATLNNSANKSHTIKDLFVTFKFTDASCYKDDGTRNFHLTEFYGTRATLDYREWVVGYQHSHLGVRYLTNYDHVFQDSDFCTGSGEINDLFAELGASYEENNFQLFLLMLQTYVHWESIEGTPYIRFNKVLSPSSDSYSVNKNWMGYDCYNDFKNRIDRRKAKLKADFVFKKDRFIIRKRGKFTAFLEEEVKNNPDLRKKVYVKKINDRYYTQSKHSITHTPEYLKEAFSDGDGNPAAVIFRGEDIPFRVLLHNQQEEESEDAYEVHPNFINQIAKLYENDIYKKQIIRSAIESQAKGNYAKTSIA